VNIAYEDNMRRIKDRINILGQHNNLQYAPKNLFFYGLDTFPKINNGGLELLKRVVTEKPELKFIVIDTLGRGIEQKKSKNGNHFQDEYEFGAELQKFAISNNICLLVLHHTRKAISDNPYDDIAGTTGLQAAPDGLMILKKNGAKTNLYITGKDIPEDMFEMELDECNWKIKNDAPQDNYTPERKEILSVFQANPEKDFTPSEIAIKVNKTPTNVSHQLKKLYSEGILRKPKFGLYRLNIS
jgi:DNA-binding transcriptional ArsR family regulator